VLKILDNHKELLLGSRDQLASLLPSLWNNLHPIFNLTEKTESSVWAVYYEGNLLLSSQVILQVGLYDKMRSITELKRLLAPIGGTPGEFSLNTYSLFFGDNKQIELFVHMNVPFIFIKLYIVIEVFIDNFDQQTMSDAYFNFILKHGLISVCKGIIFITEEKEPPKTEGKIPDLYGGLYNEK